MAMVISSRAKGMIAAFICLIFLSAALVTASTKGWLFGLSKNNGEHVAARIQGAFQFLKLYGYPDFISIVCNKTTTKVANNENDFNDYGNENGPVLQPPPEYKNYGYRMKGEKGDRGPKGPPGDSIRGAAGPPGPQGPKGECIYSNSLDSTKFNHIPSTSCSCNVNHLMDILRNDTVKEILRGLPGRSGMPGFTGVPGERGFPGLKGDKGDVGPMGPEGLQGNKGEQGIDGIPGMPGADGAPGENYEPPSNWDSSRMFKESMIAGIPAIRTTGTAQKGEKGEVGLKGERGIQGSKGDRGDRGLTGMKGERGDSAVGPPGQKGDNGQPGHKGEKGPPGLPGTVIYSDMQNLTNCACTGQKGEKGQDGQVIFVNDTMNVVKGEKGERGPRGKKGKQGPMGPPGRPAPQGDIGVPGYPGRSGLPGLPGIKGQKGEIGNGMKGDKGNDGMPGPPGLPGNSFGSVGTITFQNTETMLKMSAVNPVGTIAFILDEEAILVRVNKGWQYIALGTLLPLATQPMTTTSVSPSYGPDLQASNLLNSNILKLPDSYTFTTPPEYESWNPKMLRMAALNEPFTGNLQGMRNADMNCHRQARRAGLLGTFRAFLSARIQNLDSIVKPEDRDLPITNLRGDVLFNSWNSIFSAQGGFFSQAPRIYSFSGKNILNDPTWPHKVVWHGAKMDSIDSNCDGWHVSLPDKVGLGSSLLGNKLLDQEMYSCQQRNIVLCIEVLPHDTRRKRDAVNQYHDEYSEQSPFIESSYHKYLEEME